MKFSQSAQTHSVALRNLQKYDKIHLFIGYLVLEIIVGIIFALVGLGTLIPLVLYSWIVLFPLITNPWRFYKIADMQDDANALRDAVQANHSPYELIEAYNKADTSWLNAIAFKNEWTQEYMANEMPEFTVRESVIILNQFKSIDSVGLELVKIYNDYIKHYNNYPNFKPADWK